MKLNLEMNVQSCMLDIGQGSTNTQSHKMYNYIVGVLNIIITFMICKFLQYTQYYV